MMHSHIPVSEISDFGGVVLILVVMDDALAQFGSKIQKTY